MVKEDIKTIEYVDSFKEMPTFDFTAFNHDCLNVEHTKIKLVYWQE